MTMEQKAMLQGVLWVGLICSLPWMIYRISSVAERKKKKQKKTMKS